MDFIFVRKYCRFIVQTARNQEGTVDDTAVLGWGVGFCRHGIRCLAAGRGSALLASLRDLNSCEIDRMAVVLHIWEERDVYKGRVSEKRSMLSLGSPLKKQLWALWKKSSRKEQSNPAQWIIPPIMK
ncbi:hypothetical protein SKAU_G00015790 [Synaphobranchus kaupii]|uniref:Uncharacterized protein n=1 Tax=Synaphobranchus kaupii TaxID=118154 RepID=A0A9Q1JBP5_SYNKA|nr:hypothetical protein SKAU_G00015790 [Synaphobranchus kaupii]